MVAAGWCFGYDLYVDAEVDYVGYRSQIVEVGWGIGIDTKEDKLLLLCSYDNSLWRRPT